MQTHFTPEQLRDPHIRESERILRNCVHCGFCLPTCPTYHLSGDELESPRGRIYLIKEMLENEQTPSPEVVKHIDQCLSCLSCMTTCPSGVNYMHLIDEGRAYIETIYRRPFLDRMKRRLFAAVLPSPRRFYLALKAAQWTKFLQPLLPGRLRRMARIASADIMQPAAPQLQSVYKTTASRRGAVGLLAGCVQQVTDNDINGATIRVLNHLGYDVHILKADCCGAIEHHLGKRAAAEKRVAGNIRSWSDQVEQHELAAVIVNASGCGTMLKDYEYIMRQDEALAEGAAAVSRLCRDITEYLVELDPDIPETMAGGDLKVAYQNPCSMQHGQGIRQPPVKLLTACGYRVLPIKNDHFCCGSAGTYNLMQPHIAEELGRRKAADIEAVQPDVIASGNLGCMTQLAAYTDIPIRHTIQLLDEALTLSTGNSDSPG
ncbi:MAG: glycolate oxidase subunit GlcF [Gammaproteobacteria bacterium]